MISQLLEAIADVQMWRISSDQMVILGPPNTLTRAIEEEFTNGKESVGHCLTRRSEETGEINRFNGVMFIEDAALTQIVVKSLISDHRVIVHL